MNIAHWLSRTARVAGDSPALMLGADVVADYATFHARAAGLAAALRAEGTGPGDRIAIFATNCPDYLVALFGIWTAGAVAVPINAKLHPKEAAFILVDSGAARGFTSAALTDPLARETDLPLTPLHSAAFSMMTATAPAPVADRRAGDLAWLFYTSGTTGKPKGVQITHGMIAATSVCYPIDVDPVDRADAALYAAPMSHGAGIYAPIHVRMGARQLVPPSGGFDAAEVLALSADHGPTSMFMAPTMLRRLTDTAKAQGARGDGIKTIVYGGGPMYRADIEEAVDWFGPKFVQIYGQGECPMAITALARSEVADRVQPNGPARRRAGGRRPRAWARSPSPMRADRPLPEGEICRGDHGPRPRLAMPGYWNNPEASGKDALGTAWLMNRRHGPIWMPTATLLLRRPFQSDVIISGGYQHLTPRSPKRSLAHPYLRPRRSRSWPPLGRMGRRSLAFVRRDRPAGNRSRALDVRICVAQYRPVQAAQDPTSSC